MPKRTDISSVLVIGTGPIVVRQAFKLCCSAVTKVEGEFPPAAPESGG
jgi:hypothetical protein